MENQDLRFIERRRIEAAFAGVFDRSRLMSLAAVLVGGAGELPPGVRQVGAGTAFTSWLVPMRGAGGAGAEPMDLAVNVAHKEWLAEVPGQRARWRDALRRVRTARFPLVPPLETLELDDRLAIVMPHGPDPWEKAGPVWQPVAALVDELRSCLGSLRLTLGDVPQGRCWRGIPFVHDWSDLAAP